MLRDKFGANLFFFVFQKLLVHAKYLLDFDPDEQMHISMGAFRKNGIIVIKKL